MSRFCALVVSNWRNDFQQNSKIYLNPKMCLFHQETDEAKSFPQTLILCEIKFSTISIAVLKIEFFINIFYILCIEWKYYWNYLISYYDIRITSMRHKFHLYILLCYVQILLDISICKLFIQINYIHTRYNANKRENTCRAVKLFIWHLSELASIIS